MRCIGEGCLNPHPDHEQWECFTAEECESEYDRFERRHPFLMRWEWFKLCISEWWHELEGR